MTWKTQLRCREAIGRWTQEEAQAPANSSPRHPDRQDDFVGLSSTCAWHAVRS